LPAGQVLVDGLGVVEIRLRYRHLVNTFAVDHVRHAHRDRVQAAKHVKLRQHEVRESVDTAGVACHRRVIPSAAPRPPRCDTVLAAMFTQPLPGVVPQFGWEWSLSYTCHIRLHNAHDTADTRRADAASGAGTACGRIG